MPTIAGGTVTEQLFCNGKVQYYHQPIGIIVANSHYLAMTAAKNVKIYYTTPKGKPLFNIKDVLAAQATERITVRTAVKAKSKGLILKFSIQK